MGNYISIDSLTERMTSTVLIELCAGLTGDAQTTFLTNVITRAESIVDGFASVIWSTPLPATGNAEEWSYCIAEYELYKRAFGSDVPPKHKMSYDETMKLLEMVSKGLYIPSLSAVRKTTAGNSVAWYSDTALFNNYAWQSADTASFWDA